MNKTNGFQYTGMTSASYDKVSVREKIKEQKEKVQREVEPFAPAIFELIQSEKDSFGLMLAGLIDSEQTPQQVQTHIEAVKLHRDFMQRFSAKVEAILRVGRNKPVKQAESFDEIIKEGKKHVR